MTTIQINKGQTDALPEEVGYRPEKIEELNAHFMKLIKAGKLQGASYLLAKDGKIFAHQAFGRLNHTNNSPPLLTSSIRQIYSIGKVFTATAIMQLIERGLLFLDQSVSTILPEFDKDRYKDITIYHLLTHTSGLRGDSGFFLEPYPLPSYDNIATKAKQHNYDINWIQTILLGLPANEPNKEWIYATSGFKLLNEIVQRVTGKFIDDYMLDEILNPIGMNNSYFNLPTHLHDEALVTSDWQKETLKHTVTYDDIPRMGRGIYSTLADLNKFAQMMLNKGTYNGCSILAPKTVELQTRNHLSNIESYGWGTYTSDYQYGLGWAVDHFDLASVGTFSHEGYGHCGMYIDPVEQFTYIFFVPSEQGFVEEAVVNSRAIVWSGIN